MTPPIAPPVDVFRVEERGDEDVLFWDEPEGEYEGVLIFAGPDRANLHQITRLPRDRESYVVGSADRDRIYAIVTCQGSRASEYCFASTDAERMSETPSEDEAPQQADMEQDDGDLKESRCVECDGHLNWVEVEQQGRRRRMLECERCGKRHVRSGDGRILMVDQLHYGCCRCPECDEVRALAMSSDDLIICSRTGRVHAWQGDAGEVDLADL